MFEGKARLQYDNGVLRAVVGRDFGAYYLWLFRASIYKTRFFWLPRHSNHITVFNPKFDGFNILAKDYDKLNITFFYDPQTIRRGGGATGFEGYYLDVYSDDLEYIRKRLKPKPGNRFLGFHVSLFHDKHDKIPSRNNK